MLIFAILLLSGAFGFSAASAYADVIDYNVNVKPTLNLSVSASSLSLNLNPNNNDFGSRELNVAVGTNNLDGYRLYISSQTVSSDATSLISTTSSANKIETLSSTATNATSSNFPVNKWGYRITSGTNTNPAITSTTDYYSFVSGTWLNYSTAPVNNSTATINFATKIDYEKPAGTYERTFDFKALPEVTQTYMQNMSPSVCTTEPTIVIDSRDEHPYVVQRLADGKCWMLDNLDLDLTNKTIVDGLTAANTNINVEADPYALESLKNGYRNGENCSEVGTNCDRYATAGLEYHNWTGAGMEPVSPNVSFSQPLINRGGKCDPTKNAIEGNNFPCVGVWQNANYTNNTVLNKAGAANTVYKSIDAETGDSIGGPGGYRIGTYYNYCAASAGTYCYGNDTSLGPSSSNATSDICPAGWHMPSDNGGANGDYLVLCSAIKGGSGCSSGSWNDMDITMASSMQYQLSLPISGNYSGGTSYRQGTYGYFWSSTYHGDGTMKYLLVRSSGVYAQTNSARNSGFSVRCVSS